MPKTKIIKIKGSFDKEDMEGLEYSAEVLRTGGLVAFPTETVYGLGANALDSNAVSNIFKAKGRPQDNPLIVHLEDAQRIEEYAHADENIYFSRIKDLFPAPLTVVLEKRSTIPDVVSAGLPTAGFRVPQNAIARKLIELSGVPVAAPSGNLSGRPSPTKAEHIIEDMYGRADVIIDGGDCSVGVESTIVSLASNPPVLLRPGGVSYENLCDILGEVSISSAVLSEMKAGEVAAAPGMKYRHYAPKAPVTLVIGDNKSARAYINEKSINKCVAVLCFDEDLDYIKADYVLCIGKHDDADEQGRRIFDALRKTDSCDGITEVYARCTDDRKGVGFAVFNRLLKASGFTVVEL